MRSHACSDQQVYLTAGRGGFDPMGFKERHAAAWTRLDGVDGIGVGGCCRAGGGANDVCLRVSLSPCTTPASDVVERIVRDGRADGLAGARIVIGIETRGPFRPRCRADDPRCGPEPYAGAGYRPDRPRRPVHLAIPDLSGYSGGPCAHDGECHRAGCGQSCVPWNQRYFDSTCGRRRELEGALCGCIGGECTWFTQ